MQPARKQVLIANWKMNPRTIGDAKALFLTTRKEVQRTKGAEVIIAAPAPFLAELRKLSSGRRTLLAAQDLFWEKEGAYTGEVSAAMLKSVGVSHVIIGHSERRALGESDEMVNKKVKSAVSFGLAAVICVGERERDTSGKYLGVVEAQLRSALRDVPRAKLEQILIAYEPVWAISTTKDAKVATPNDVHEMVLFIRKVLTDMYGRAAALGAHILYGGSVHPKNIEELRAQSEADGYLVGGVSLKPKDFASVITTVYGTRSL